MPVTHCSHSSGKPQRPIQIHVSRSKAHTFGHSSPLPLGLMEGPVCLLGRGQGRHGSNAGVELRLLWEEGWGREDLAGFLRPRELTTWPSMATGSGVHHFLLRALPVGQVPVV